MNRNLKFYLLSITILFSLFFSSCAGPILAPSPTSTPLSTWTPFPTYTLYPTQTPFATQTSLPTYTPYPTLETYGMQDWVKGHFLMCVS